MFFLTMFEEVTSNLPFALMRIIGHCINNRINTKNSDIEALANIVEPDQTRHSLQIIQEVLGFRRIGSELYLFIIMTRMLELNPFVPDYLKWPLPSLNLDMSTGANRGFSLK